MRGVAGARPPLWATILRMTERGWGPPWEIEEQCSQLWLERFVVYERARNAAT